MAPFQNMSRVNEIVRFAARRRSGPILLDRKIDVFLGRVAIPPADDRRLVDLNVEILFHDQLAIATGTQNGWARRRRIDLAELVNEPWILAARIRGTIGDCPKRSLLCGSILQRLAW
jgi:hypothetical protein